MLTTPIAWLESHGAQRDVIDGLRPLASDWNTLWTTCARGDWLLGIAARAGVDHAVLVRAAASCARLALRHARVEGAAELVDVAERWSRGGATASAVASATRDFERTAAQPAAPTDDAAAQAALAVGLGVADREATSSAAAAAAQTVIFATMTSAGVGQAIHDAHAACAAAVREAIPWPELARALDLEA